MDKKKKRKIVVGTLIVVALLIALYLFMNQPLAIVDIPINNSTGGGGSSSLGGGGGGGSSSGGGGGTNNIPPEDGFLCTTCETIFLEGNPEVVMRSFTQDSIPLYYNLIPRAMKPQGHWNCMGNCTYNGVDVSSTYNCVINPTQNKPDNGWDDITGEKPNCLCLPEKPGNCAWYDEEYGSGIDNIQCGGSCPAGEVCSVIKTNGREICNCTKESQVEKCGFHVDSLTVAQTTSVTNKEELKRLCYGWCDTTQSNDCQYWEDEDGQPTCDCWGPKDTKVDCKNVDVSQGWWKCWTDGVCPETGEECVFDQYYGTCGCQNKDDCGWHITLEQAEQMQGKFQTPQEALNYLIANWQLYCYGLCSSNEYCQYKFVPPSEGRTWPIYDCGCGTVMPPTITQVTPTSGLTTNQYVSTHMVN